MVKWLCIIFLFFSSFASAAELATEHTYSQADGESLPVASIEDASWLAGSWKGTAFGKHFEENWSAPSQGSMLGMFKLYDDSGIDFYELMLLSVEDGSLSLKVKHFTSDFVAWEEKPDFVTFRLVKLERDALHFSGLSFYRRDADHIDAWIVMRNGEEISEQALNYVRH